MPDKEVDLNDEANKDSAFASYCAPCEKCGGRVDHPPITVPTGRAFFERKDPGLPLVLSIPSTNLCRFCLLRAIAPLDEPVIEDPEAGWLWRKIINGELEPSGTKGSRKKRVGEEVPRATNSGSGDTEGDQE